MNIDKSTNNRKNHKRLLKLIIPISRIVGVQSKTNNSISPIFPFSYLLSKLSTKNTVRIVPIGVSSAQARDIQGIMKINNKHFRHPRFIQRTQGGNNNHDNAELELDAENIKTHKELSEGMLHNFQYEINFNEDKTEEGGNEIVKTEVVKLKPRGSATGFSKHKQYTIATNSMKNKNPLNIGKLSSPSIEYGFKPLEPEIEQRERYTTAHTNSRHLPVHNKNKDYITGQSKYLPRIDKTVQRKSNQDFLGIFDTRKFFFIPPSRSIENERNKVLPNLINLFMK